MVLMITGNEFDYLSSLPNDAVIINNDRLFFIVTRFIILTAIIQIFKRKYFPY